MLKARNIINVRHSTVDMVIVSYDFTFSTGSTYSSMDIAKDPL